MSVIVTYLRSYFRVCTENLNPDVMVMQSAEDRVRLDIPDPLNGTKGRRIFVQRPVRSDVIVIEGIGSQDPAQMPLAHDHHVVHALAADRSDQSFGIAVLPR